jgi:hypothetical protein
MALVIHAVILVTQEAEFRRISVKPSRANGSTDFISKISNTKKGWRSGLRARVPA